MEDLFYDVEKWLKTHFLKKKNNKNFVLTSLIYMIKLASPPV